MYSFSYLEPVWCSMYSSNCCFLTCIQISQEAVQMVWYSQFLKNFPKFVVIHTVKRRRQWHPTPVLLPAESHGQRSLVGCRPWGREESETTEGLHFHFSLSCIGKGNGNPLQCSCLENPRDAGASWAAVYGVAQSRTWLKQFSSSNPLNMWFANMFFTSIGSLFVLWTVSFSKNYSSLI